MLRQLAKTTTMARRHLVLQRSIVRACLSTAPMPKISLSYEEWAAQNLGRTQNQSKRQQPRGTNAPNVKSRRVKPSKYKSLVYFPESVTLTFPNCDNDNSFQLDCLDFAIAQPGRGGHVLVAPNGSGKSLLVQHLASSSQSQTAHATSDQDNNNWKIPRQMAYVSFDSHLQVLHDHPHCTVYESITGGTGNLSKAAQYLVVRFGLFPILHRTLSTLSTGEIRKALLVSALAQQPQLLVLENAFDGLDTKSRTELQTIVSKTIQGLDKSGKLLVQHVTADYVPPAQVLLSTHRPEEIVPEINTVSYIMDQNVVHNNSDNKHNNNNNNNKNTLVTIPRPSNYSQEQLMYMALGLDKNHNKNTTNWSVVAPWDDPDPTLPSVVDIQQWWWPLSSEESERNNPLLSLDQVQIRRRRDGLQVVQEQDDEEEDQQFATLLHPLSWNIEPGQRWLIAGGNGAGKSTLSRFLLQESNDTNNTQPPDDSTTTTTTTQDMASGVYQKDPDTTIAWVSTESHLGLVENNDKNTTAWDIIAQQGAIPESKVNTLIQWVFGDKDYTTTVAATLKERSLQQLSQGEQKLVLIASALAKQSKLLILDEPTQGLDWVHRRRILALLERLCQANPELSLVFITHYQEEWIPSISHVLHLERGQALYQGARKNYNPTKL